MPHSPAAKVVVYNCVSGHKGRLTVPEGGVAVGGTHGVYSDDIKVGGCGCKDALRLINSRL